MAKGLRRRYLIDPAFQLGFLVHAIAAAVVVIIVLYGANFYFFWRFRDMGRGLNLPANHVYFQFLDKQVTIMNLVFVATSAVVLLVVIGGGMLLSHRIAGPVYRICKEVEEMTRTGNLREIKLRKKDYFPQLAAAFNSMIRQKFRAK